MTLNSWAISSSSSEEFNTMGLISLLFNPLIPCIKTFKGRITLNCKNAKEIKKAITNAIVKAKKS